MLTNDDILWIKSNRDEMTHNRTDTLATWGEVVTGTNPITGEESYGMSAEVLRQGVVTFPSDSETDVQTIDGYTIKEGDILVDFNADIPVNEIDFLRYLDVEYEVIAKTPKGIGVINRFTCLARRVT